MAAEIISKRCSKCKDTKQFSEFHKHSAYKDGYRNWCKTCRAKYQKKYRQTEKGKNALRRYKQSEKGKINAIKSSSKQRILYPQQIKARNAVNDAIKVGKLISPKLLLCHYCPKPAQDYHHHLGYTPKHCLDVIPVCKGCHSKLKKEKSLGEG